VNAAPPRESSTDAALAPAGAASWPTLLVIDSDPEMLRTLVCFFERRGFHVAAAQNVSEAKVYFQRHPRWTMVISDYHLPDGNGWDFCTWMQEQLGAGTSTPFLLMSGGTHASTICPALDFLAKPFRVEELEARVQTLLRLRHN
jgi:DNA-binding response OmpR family regulator